MCPFANFSLETSNAIYSKLDFGWCAPFVRKALYNSLKMVKKCCTPGCRGNYDAKNKVRVYTLPSNEEERNCWVNSILISNFPNKPDTVVCERHFPENLLKAHVNDRKFVKSSCHLFQFFLMFHLVLYQLNLRNQGPLLKCCLLSEMKV